MLTLAVSDTSFTLATVAGVPGGAGVAAATPRGSIGLLGHRRNFRPPKQQTNNKQLTGCHRLLGD